MQILPLSEASRQAWDDLAVRSNEAWLFHLYDWAKIEEASYRSLSFLVKEGNDALGIFPLYLGRRMFAGFLSVKTLHTGWGRTGPALAPGLSEKRSQVVYRRMFEYVDELAKEHHVDRLEIRLPSLAPSYLPPLREWISPLNFYGPFTPLKYGHLLDRPVVFSRIIRLERSPEKLWGDLDEDCRNAVRKARKNGVVVRRGETQDDLEEFYRLHVEGYQSTGATPHTREFLEILWGRFHPHDSVNIFFAEYQSQLIGGVMVLSFKNAATYWAGSSKPDWLHLRPNNLLIWEAMCWAKDRGCEWFEVGPTFPFLNSDSKLYRIGQFKNQFGGEAFALFEGAKNYRPFKVAGLDLVDALADHWTKNGILSRLRNRGS